MQDHAIQYEEPIYCDPAFPVSFHEDYMAPNRRVIYTHWHAGVEFLYFHEGSGHLISKSHNIGFSEGDLLVIGSHALHTLCAETPHCRYHCLVVEPHFLINNGIAVDQTTASFVVHNEDAGRLMQTIIREIEGGEALYKTAVLGCILQLFTVLHRNRSHSEPQPSKDEGSIGRQQSSVELALHYIRENLSRAIALEDLCHHVGMSKYYFCRMFKTYTGIPPLQYINMMRCDQARHLITEGTMTVSEAAHAVGVDNASYFTKIYKKFIGTLPSVDAAKKEARDRKGEIVGVLKTLR